MHLNEFGREWAKSKEVDVDTKRINKTLAINNLLLKNCKIAYQSPFKIYRGMRTSEEILVSDSTKYERRSRNTANFYTILFDHILPEWAQYPKRSRSFICSVNEEKARAYGDLYRVYPIGDPLIGICPKRDIWDCFPFEISDLDRLFEPLGMNDNLKSMKEGIKKLDSNWGSLIDKQMWYGNYDLIKDFFGSSPERYSSFTELLRYWFNPKKNHFKCKRLSQLENYPSEDEEIWFSGPAYFKNLYHYNGP